MFLGVPNYKSGSTPRQFGAQLRSQLIHFEGRPICAHSQETDIKALFCYKEHTKS